MAEIQLIKLEKQFADFTAVKGSSIVLEDGKFVVLLGPSGCGKTTTLRMIAGLEYPTSGQILLDNEDVTYRRPRERDIAMVFQLFALYPHMRVGENLEFPLRNEGLPKTEIKQRVQKVAEILRIEHLLGSRVGGLAGGDRQRVALGRAIVRQPKAFLMDEPLGTLDAEFRELMCVELRQLHDKLKTTTVFVTHDQNEAMALADCIVVMNKGEILQADDTDGIYNFPSCMFVASFIGRPSMNLLQTTKAVVKGDQRVSFGNLEVTVPTVQEAAQKVTMGIRPEHIRVVSAQDGMPATVNYAEYFGSHWVLDLDCGMGRVKAVASKDVCPVDGDTVGLQLTTERVVLFNSETEQLLASSTTQQHKPRMRHG